MTEPTEPLTHHTVVAFGKYLAGIVGWPVPAPEPAVERVPWHEAKDRMLMWAGKTCGLCFKVALDGYGRAKAWYVDGDDERYITADVDGMVSVLRDADPTPTDKTLGDALDECPTEADKLRLLFAGQMPTPTDPPSERCAARDRGLRCLDNEGHPGVHHVQTGSGAMREWGDPVPSVVPADSPDHPEPAVVEGIGMFPARTVAVPADSPDTGRWKVDASTPHVIRNGDQFAECYREGADDTPAPDVAAALVRRDRPQPTAEQIRAQLIADGVRPPATETIRAVLAAVDACRTTEGTGE